MPEAFVNDTPWIVDAPEMLRDAPWRYPLAVRLVPLALVNVSPVIVDVPTVNTPVELTNVNDESPPSVEEER